MNGIEGIEVKRLRIEGNIFEALTGATGAGIKTTAGLGLRLLLIGELEAINSFRVVDMNV